MLGGAQPPRSPKSLTQRCDDDQLIKFHLIVQPLSPWDLFLFCGAARGAHHIVRYCLKWFNKHFVLRRSVIILRPSRQPMALQISPILSTPHFILLHAGRFTARQRRWLKATGKVVPLLSQRIIKQTPEPSARERLFPQPQWACTTRNAASCLLQTGMCWDWGLFDVFCYDQLRGLMVIWCLCGAIGDVGAQSECVCLCVCVCLLVCVPVTEHLIAAVMYPHYAPVPWPSHPALPDLSWGPRMSGLPLLSTPPAPNPLPFWLQPPIPQPALRVRCWVVLLTNGCSLVVLTEHEKLVFQVLQAELRVMYIDLIIQVWTEQTGLDPSVFLGQGVQLTVHMLTLTFPKQQEWVFICCNLSCNCWHVWITSLQ